MKARINGKGIVPEFWGAEPWPQPSRYRKTATVLAMPALEPGTIETTEGVMSFEAGDYIVTDDPPTHAWPVRREVFERTHELIAEPAP